MTKLNKNLEYDCDKDPIKEMDIKKTDMDKNKLINVSKKLSWILRHGVNKENIPITKNGFISLDIISKYIGISEKDVLYIVLHDDKERYKVVYSNKNYDIYIRDSNS